MIIVMRRDAKEQDIEHMIKQVESLGLKPTVLRGTERTVIAAIGDERNAPAGGFSKAARVSTKCSPFSRPTRSPASKPNPSRPSSAPAA